VWGFLRIMLSLPTGLRLGLASLLEDGQHGCRRVPKHEIEVERGDCSAVDGRGCIADQHGFQVVLFERAKNSAKEWGGVHDR